jgi:hypothetical protein
MRLISVKHTSIPPPHNNAGSNAVIGNLPGRYCYTL